MNASILLVSSSISNFLDNAHKLLRYMLVIYKMLVKTEVVFAKVWVEVFY
jgi:hypothetical protein